MNTKKLFFIFTIVMLVLTACATPTSATPQANATPPAAPQLTAQASKEPVALKSIDDSNNCLPGMKATFTGPYQTIKVRCPKPGVVYFSDENEEQGVMGYANSPLSVYDNDMVIPEVRFDGVGKNLKKIYDLKCTGSGQFIAKVSVDLKFTCADKDQSVNVTITYPLVVLTTTNIVPAGPKPYLVGWSNTTPGNAYLWCRKSWNNPIKYSLGLSSVISDLSSECKAGTLLNKDTYRVSWLSDNTEGGVYLLQTVTLQPDSMPGGYEAVSKKNLVVGTRYHLSALGGSFKIIYKSDDTRTVDTSREAIYLGTMTDGSMKFNDGSDFTVDPKTLDKVFPAKYQ
jgi:hypothetical protein